MQDKVKSRLTGLRCYLSGPCENLKDSGADWRTKITPKLKKLGLIVFDPVSKNGVKLSFTKENNKEFEYVSKLRDEEDYERLSECMREVVHLDLRLCDVSDLLIVQLDKNAPTCGTYDEIVTVLNQKKPVYICSKQGKKHIPLWLYGRIKNEYIFESLDEIEQKLNSIAYCDESILSDYIDKRWLFSNSLGV